MNFMYQKQLLLFSLSTNFLMATSCSISFQLQLQPSAGPICSSQRKESEFCFIFNGRGSNWANKAMSKTATLATATARSRPSAYSSTLIAALMQPQLQPMSLFRPYCCWLSFCLADNVNQYLCLNSSKKLGPVVRDNPGALNTALFKYYIVTSYIDKSMLTWIKGHKSYAAIPDQYHSTQTNRCHNILEKYKGMMMVCCIDSLAFEKPHGTWGLKLMA